MARPIGLTEAQQRQVANDLLADKGFLRTGARPSRGIVHHGIPAPGAREYFAGGVVTKGGVLLAGGVPFPFAAIEFTPQGRSIVEKGAKRRAHDAGKFETQLRNWFFAAVSGRAQQLVHQTLDGKVYAVGRKRRGAAAANIAPLTRAIRKANVAGRPLKETGLMKRTLKFVVREGGQVSVETSQHRTHALRAMEEGSVIRLTPKYKAYVKARIWEERRKAGGKTWGRGGQNKPVPKSQRNAATGRLQAWLSVLGMFRAGSNKRVKVPARPVLRPAFEMAHREVMRAAEPNLMELARGFLLPGLGFDRGGKFVATPAPSFRDLSKRAAATKQRWRRATGQLSPVRLRAALIDARRRESQ